MFNILIFSLCAIFSSFTYGVSAPPKHTSTSCETSFLDVMQGQLGKILADCPDINSEFFNVKPLTDGGTSFINSVYLITLTDGTELIIKISNPLWKKFKTDNEVYALKLLKNHSSIPVPAVYSYCDDVESSLIQAEYIIMPRVKGKPLSSEINEIYENKQVYHKILDQLASSIAELKLIQFSNIGNFLGYSETNSTLQLGGIVDFSGYELSESCNCYSEYARHSLNYYVLEMERLALKKTPEEPIYRRYIPILKDLLSNVDFRFLDSENDKFVMSHQDFVMKNILVDDDQVTAVLDWEWSGSTLMEIEGMTGFDFLLNDEDRIYFANTLENLGIKNFFDPPPLARQSFYKLIGNVYTLVAFREWREGKLEHTAKFLCQKLEQRQIRNNPNFDVESFLNEVCENLNQCIGEINKHSK